MTFAEKVGAINDVVNGFIWGLPMMILIVGTGIYLTCGIGFKQVSRFGYWIKKTIGAAFGKNKVEAKEGAITPFQAVCTALAGSIGTGNVAGVAGAIAIGGPGAVFWMLVAAFFGQATKFAEVTLAIKYRERNKYGDWVGGPMYYIKNGLSKKWTWLAYVFSFLGLLCGFGIANLTQTNTIAGSIIYAVQATNPNCNEGTIRLVIGIVLAILCAIVIIGGIKRIGQACEVIVPFMAIGYIVIGLIVIFTHAQNIGPAFKAIFSGAFNPSALGGGLAGTVMMTTLKKGVGRGLFSNEAGLGSAPMGHAAAEVDHPVQQGIFGFLEVFMDTLVVCTLTALIILCGLGLENVPFGVSAASELTAAGVASTFGNLFGRWFIAVAIALFAFSSTLSWSVYGSRCAEFVFGEKAILPYKILWCIACILGPTVSLDLVWGISDTLNGMMAIPNLVALLLLSPTVFQLTREYFEKVDAERKAAK